MSPSSRHPRPLRRVTAVATIVGLAGALVPAASALAQGRGDRIDGAPAATVPFALVEDRDVDDRLPQPEDRYAVAGGCYTLELAGAGYVARDGDALTVTAGAGAAEPFHLQPLRLGEYLLAANEGPDTRWEDAWWDVRSYVTRPADPVTGLVAPAVTLADEPSTAGEWRLAAVGEDPDRRVDTSKRNRTASYVLSSAAGDGYLTTSGGDVTTSDDAAEAATVVLRHVADDDPTDDDPNGTACATWPEIQTNVEGSPSGVKGNPAQPVRGFFEAHVHGMAFEFLGGELRCGRPWHPYGVEHALGDCNEEGNALNGVLEVGVAGQDPSDPVASYDPVGWPTFAYWPQHDTLTHEQFYWRWVERAYLGGLRLVTNLLVDNTALCQAYPVKRNSCNEMDGVRLQAKRLFELQDYIDAQSGGPGEGWLRIVTTPAQARRTINAGRLAVVMGIEVSVLFDCGEVLDVPQCTEDDIDDRLREVLDMGVRQMELVNKFDNALSGVTGDGGSTGVVVNTGNRWITGHYWDMRTCVEDDHDHGIEDDEHDKHQTNVSDDRPEGGPEEIDVLAGTILDLFGPTKGYVAPAYPAGPHCNSRGLTDLGAHLVERMTAAGVIFDPDHMSALAQRQALDLIEDEIVPAREREAKGRGRAATVPGVISSHSWGNDVTYQRIYRLGGVVAPRTGTAGVFADRWAQHRAWAEEHAPDGYDFGMGYGADTNGLGAQPGPRSEAAERVSYDRGWVAPIGGVTFHQQTSGVRTYDVNTDGVAHYGLFADWFRELALAADERHAGLGGGAAIIDDMLDGAETYLAMWERAVYGGNDCVVDGSTLQQEDLHAALGLNVDGFLEAIGQPVDREGAAYVYCAEGEDGQLELVEVLFDEQGEAVESRRTDEDPEGLGPTPAGDDHVHAAPAEDGSLPATGGGLLQSGMLLLGLAGLGSSALGRGGSRSSRRG
jgi:hypothetical protein